MYLGSGQLLRFLPWQNEYFLHLLWQCICQGDRVHAKYVISVNCFCLNYSIYSWIHALFYKQHFYEQYQAEIGKKIKRKLSNTWLMLKFSSLKIIRFLHPRCFLKILDILKNAQKTSASVLMTLYEYWQWKWSWKWKIDHNGIT